MSVYAITLLVFISISVIELLIIILLISILRNKRQKIIETFNDKIIEQKQYEKKLKEKEEFYNEKIKAADNIYDLLNITDDILQNNDNRNTRLPRDRIQ